MGIVQMGNDHNRGYFKDRKRFRHLQAVAGNLVILMPAYRKVKWKQSRVQKTGSI